MNKLNNTSKLVIFAVVAVVAIGLVAWYGWGMGGSSQSTNSGSASQPSTTVAAGTMAPGETAAGNYAGTGSAAQNKGGANASPAPTIITLVSPVPGDVWKIGTLNAISWAQAANIGGQIELLDASTSRLVGVILSETGVQQTSYGWNARDVYLNRTNPSKTTVTPGRYVIKILFDGNNIAPITSQPLTLTLSQ